MVNFLELQDIHRKLLGPLAALAQPRDAELVNGGESIDLELRRQGLAPALERSGLPFGFVYDGITGQIFRQGPGGLVPASSQEVIQAMLEQKAALEAAGGAAPRLPSWQIDERTGEIIGIDPYTGAVIHTGEQGGFARIDPREEFAAEQALKGFDRELAARQQAIDLLKNAQDNLLEQARLAEYSALERGRLAQSEKQERAKLREQGRQADLNAAVQQWQTAMNLIPQLGQLSIEESRRVQDILQNGGDFLARAFESRGGTSPLAKVLQADQILALQDSLAQLRSMVDSAMASSPARAGATELFPDTPLPAFNAPVLPDESGLPPLPKFGPVQLSAPPAIPQRSSGDSGGGGYGGGGYGGGGFVAAAPELRDMTAAGQSVPPTALGVSPEDSAAIFGSGPLSPKKKYYDDIRNELARRAREFAKGIGRGRPFGYAAGGVTRDPAFIGDEEGPELYLNPTRAPIAVVPADQARGFMRRLPGYATGTGSQFQAGGPEVIFGVPTGERGFLNPAAAVSPAQLADEMAQQRYQEMKARGFFPDPAKLAGARARAQELQTNLVRMAQRTAPPAVQAVFGGQPVHPPRALESTVDTGVFMKPFTSRQLSTLSPEELQALGTRANVEFNAPLPYLLDRLRRQYGPSQERRRGFLGAAGI